MGKGGIFENMARILEDEQSKDSLKPAQDKERSKAAKRVNYTVQYVTLYQNPDATLGVVRRVGGEDTTIAESRKYIIFHIPTKTDLGIMFQDEASAREFVSMIEKKWDWNFMDIGTSDVDEEVLKQIAGRLRGLNAMGRPIARDYRNA